MPQVVVEKAVGGETVSLQQQHFPDVIVVPMRQHSAVRIQCIADMARLPSRSRRKALVEFLRE